MAAEHPVLALKRIHDATLALTVGLGIVCLAVLTGATPDEACLPVGLAGAAAGVGLLLYAARRHDRSWDAADDVGAWARAIRRMACIDIGIAVVLLAIPDVA